MPTLVHVSITDAGIIAALNTPGGAVYEWRNKVEADVLAMVHATSPVNDPLDAVHRGGIVGEFQASWVSTRAGSNGHHVRLTVENFANHAIYVEEGRSASRKFQQFSWTQWGGEIHSVGGGATRGGTGPRAGKHILRNAFNAIMPGATGGAYSPLT